jgi:hypothetical protein
MSGRTVTCILCGVPVDDGDTVEMPNGPMCDNCYAWLERMVDDDED